MFYATEAGNVRGAESLARSCDDPERWWCDALLGYVLHGSGRFVAADSAFEAALEAMPAGVREWYRSPEFILDGEGRTLFADADTAERRNLWTRLWLLSDPLYLVEGNDRLTAHYARRTLVRLRSGTLTPYGLPFDEDRDLEELNVRYGGERGYERIQSVPGRGSMLRDTRRIVGRHHPDDREYLPTSSFLADPAEIPPGAWTLDEPEPRTGYAAPYALAMHPLEAQVARFRRGDSLLVVASYRPASVPGARTARDDGGGNTARGREERAGEPANPFAEPEPPERGDPPSADDPAGPQDRRSGDGGGGAGPDGPVQSGVFLVTWDGAPIHDERGDAGEAVVTARVPDGAYVLGVEVWEKTADRAWRIRQGVRQESLAPDEAAVSDLLFLRPGDEHPRSLEQALPRVLPSIRVDAGESFAVAWEVYGVPPGETARVTLGFTEGEPGLLRRIGEYLRLVEPDDPVEISFEDRAPDRLGTVFRALDVDVPSFEPGVYTLHLEIELPGRDPMITSRRLTVE